jgi:hypothetical protein
VYFHPCGQEKLCTYIVLLLWRIINELCIERSFSHDKGQGGHSVRYQKKLETFPDLCRVGGETKAGIS